MAAQPPISDSTAGQFTTVKLQALLDSGLNTNVRNRRDVADHLRELGARISVHGVEAWFRRVDSNYNNPRVSLHPTQPSYGLPAKHWPLLLDLFDLAPEAIEQSDDTFGTYCLNRHAELAVVEPRLQPLRTHRPEHLPGREREMAELLRAMQHSADGQARAILLEGAAGLGKTSLIAELVNRTRSAGYLCVTASCVEDGYVPLLPLLDLVRMQLDEVARGGSEALRLAQLLGERIEQANMAEAASESAGGSGLHTAADLFLVASDLLVVLAKNAPLLVVIDDVHWLDEATLGLLVHFAQFLRLNRQHRVLLLLAGREFSTELLHKLPTGDFSQRLELKPLQRGAVRSAARRLLGTDLGVQAREFVWNISEGNPLYVEQLTQHLATSRQLETTNGVMELVAPADAIQVPASLDDYYRRRFELLDSDAARLLQLAACMGQTVNGEFLQFLVPGTDTSSLFAALDRAENTGLLKFERNSYQFTHPVARHTVYVSNTDSRRAQLHAQIADAIEVSLPERSPHASIELAYHLVRGRPHSDANKTLQACSEAARHSHNLSAWPSTEYFASAALELDADYGGLVENDRGTLLQLRGTSRHQTARPLVALQDLEAALERFQSGQNTADYTRTLSQVVRIRANFSEAREGHDAAAEELSSYVELMSDSDKSLAARGLEVLASYRLANNDSRAALKLVERAINEFSEDVELREYAQSQITAGMACLNHLDVQGGLSYLLAATRSARDCNSTPTLARALQRLILAQLVLGRIDDALSTAEELDQLGGAANATGEHTTVCLAMSAVLTIRGEYELALAMADDGLELVDVTGYRFLESALVGSKVCTLLQSVSGATDLAEADLVNGVIDRLEVDRPRRAAALLRSRVAVPRVIPAGGVQNFSVPENVRASAMSERLPDIGELARLLMLAELALASVDEEVLLALLPKLRAAEEVGVVFATAWPVQLPLLLGRVCLALAQERDAHYYFRQSLNYGRMNKLPAQLRLLQQVLQAEWPTELELQQETLAALADSVA